MTVDLTRDEIWFLKGLRAAGERGRLVSALASQAGLVRLVEVQYVTRRPAERAEARLPQSNLDRLFDASLVTIMGLPPKDPHDDDDENEGDEEDDDEEDEEPAVIREPDEC